MLLTHHAFLLIGKDQEAVQEKLRELLPNFLAEIRESGHPDLLTIEPQDSIKIAQVREMEKFLTFAPYSEGDFRVVVVKDAQKLTVAAQHALLKTLEEPPKSAKIILCVDDRENLLPTVVSRCSRILVNLPQKIEIPLDKQVKLTGELEDLIFGEDEKKFFLAKEISQNAANWLENEIVLWRDLLLIKTGNLGNLNFQNPSHLQKIAAKLTEDEIAKVITRLQSAQKVLLANVNPRLAIEVLFLNFPSKNSQEF